MKNIEFIDKSNIKNFKSNLAKIDKMVARLVARYCKYYHYMKDKE